LSEPPALFGVFHLVAHQIIKTPPLKSLFCNDLQQNEPARRALTPVVVRTYDDYPRKPCAKSISVFFLFLFVLVLTD